MAMDQHLDRTWLLGLPGLGPVKMPMRSTAPSNYAAFTTLTDAGIQLKFRGLTHVEATIGNISITLKRGHHA